MAVLVALWGKDVLSRSVVSDSEPLCGSSVHGILQARIWGGLPCPPPGDLPNPGIKPRSPTLQVDSLLSEPPGKPKNTGVGSPSLLQGNSATQELNLEYSISGTGITGYPYGKKVKMELYLKQN